MIIQSTRIQVASGPQRLIHHLLDKDDKPVILQGDRDTLLDAHAIARLKGCKYSIRHLAISPEASMSPQQLHEFLAQISAEFKIGPNRPCLVVKHEKKGRVHFHVAIAEVDPVTMKVLDCRKDFQRLERLARQYERSNGERVQPSIAQRKRKGVQGLSSRARKRAERVAPSFDRTQLRTAAKKDPERLLAEIERQGLRLVTGEKGPVLVSNEGIFVASAGRALGLLKGEGKTFFQRIGLSAAFLKHKLKNTVDLKKISVSNINRKGKDLYFGVFR